MPTNLIENDSRRQIVVAVCLHGLLVAACSGPEQELLDRFFAASQRGDNETVAALSMVAFPEDLTDWNVLEISEARTEPYPVPALREGVELVEDERDAQFRSFGDFRQENYDDLRRIQAAPSVTTRSTTSRGVSVSFRTSGTSTARSADRSSASSVTQSSSSSARYAASTNRSSVSRHPST